MQKLAQVSILAFLLMAGCNRQPKPEAVHIQVTSHKYAFEPAVIYVKKGQDVTLEISTTDVQHGFAVEELGIDESIQKGKPALVNFKADKAGEYKVKCSIICGPGHDRMQGKIIVE
jgi:cytochrome c oxidase subunit II